MSTPPPPDIGAEVEVIAISNAQVDGNGEVEIKIEDFASDEGNRTNFAIIIADETSNDIIKSDGMDPYVDNVAPIFARNSLTQNLAGILSELKRRPRSAAPRNLGAT